MSHPASRPPRFPSFHAHTLIHILPHTQVYESLILCDDSIRRELSSNIIISGGTSMLPGLGNRLNNDLNNLFALKEGAGKDGTAGGQTATVMPSNAHRYVRVCVRMSHVLCVCGGVYGCMGVYI